VALAGTPPRRFRRPRTGRRRSVGRHVAEGGQSDDASHTHAEAIALFAIHESVERSDALAWWQEARRASRQHLSNWGQPGALYWWERHSYIPWRSTLRHTNRL
jgi:hypothetical protein